MLLGIVSSVNLSVCRVLFWLLFPVCLILHVSFRNHFLIILCYCPAFPCLCQSICIATWLSWFLTVCFSFYFHGFLCCHALVLPSSLSDWSVELLSLLCLLPSQSLVYMVLSVSSVFLLCCHLFFLVPWDDLDFSVCSLFWFCYWNTCNELNKRFTFYFCLLDLGAFICRHSDN